MDSNKIINGLWIGDELNILGILCLKSYLSHDHTFNLYCYNNLQVPIGINLKDANKVLPNDKIFKDKHGSYATFSDWFRLELLLKHGGWWSDMDSICLKRFNTEEDYVFSSEITGLDNNLINNGNIKVTPGSKVIKDCLEYIYEQPNLLEMEWGKIGPSLLQNKVVENKLLDFVTDPNVFCPIPYFHFNIMFSNIHIEFSEITYAVHFYNEMVKRNQINLSGNFHPHSLFERLKLKYEN